MMVRVEHHRDYDIWVDKDTGVMFLCIDHQNGVGVTVMPNADGTPKIWQGDIKEYEPDFSEQVHRGNFYDICGKISRKQ